MKRLGDILVEKGVPRAAVERLVNTSAPIGHTLKSNGLIGARGLAQALAEQQHLPYVDLTQRPPDGSLFRTRDLAHYLKHRYIPYSFEVGVLTVACSDPSPELIRELAARYDCAIRLSVTSPRDLQTAWFAQGGRSISRRAKHALRRRHRGLTADRTLERPQAMGFGLLMLALLIFLIIDLRDTWYFVLIGCNLFYFVVLAFKLQLYLQGTSAARAMRLLDKQLQQNAAAIAEHTLSVYSILVPVFRESNEVLHRLLGNLSALDYPKEKLDIKLICEADDGETIEALKALRPPETMEIIAVPPSQPRTKPKACNVALQTIRGEYLVIYDAEDAPAPDQLKRAVDLFRESPANTACLQAPLNYYNRNENLLTQLFAIEYSMLFRLLLPAMERMELPIPLGGTSNHLKVEALLACGGWDAFNVTEDADLGIRLAYFGYRTRILPSLTLEEAPITLRAWMKQRTRWIKGYIQTWLVYMRDPAELKYRLGSQAYYGFQFFVGAPALTFLLAPIFWTIFILGLMGLMPQALSPAMLGFCIVSFIGGLASHWLFARKVMQLERWYDMASAGMLYPFYWLLHSIACARALWQLARAPHYWEKTTHGLSAVFKG